MLSRREFSGAAAFAALGTFTAADQAPAQPAAAAAPLK